MVFAAFGLSLRNEKSTFISVSLGHIRLYLLCCFNQSIGPVLLSRNVAVNGLLRFNHSFVHSNFSLQCFLRFLRFYGIKKLRPYKDLFNSQFHTKKMAISSFKMISLWKALSVYEPHSFYCHKKSFIHSFIIPYFHINLIFLSPSFCDDNTNGCFEPVLILKNIVQILWLQCSQGGCR